MKTKVERKGSPDVQHVGRKTRERLISGCSVKFVRTGITVECENISDSTYNTLKNEKIVHWYCVLATKVL